MTNPLTPKQLFPGRLIASEALWLAAILLLAAIPVRASISVNLLRCESRRQPLGVDDLKPRLSWVIASKERNQKQTAYRVLVASSEKSLEEEQGDLWDSGKVASSETIGIAYAGRPLRSGQRCHWKVQVWDQEAFRRAGVNPTWWEMGLLQSGDWRGQWLNDGKSNPTNDAEFYQEDPAPLFRRELRLTKPVRRARLYISGLGYYEASLNGQRVGDQVLDPGWTMYGKRVFYSTYDVGSQLRPATNCLGVTLGNGWWNPLPLRLWGRRDLRKELAVGRPRFIAQLNIEFTDGTTESFASDAAWKVADGRCGATASFWAKSMMRGRNCPAGTSPGSTTPRGARAKPATEPIGPLQAQPQPPIRVRETFPAVRVTEPKPGFSSTTSGRIFPAGRASVLARRRERRS